MHQCNSTFQSTGVLLFLSKKNPLESGFAESWISPISEAESSTWTGGKKVNVNTRSSLLNRHMSTPHPD